METKENINDINIYQIALNLDLNTLFNGFCYNSYFTLGICQSKSFWVDKIENDFGYMYKINDDISPFKYYLKAMDKYIVESIKKLDIKSINYVIERGFKNWCVALYEAGKLGDKIIINYIINKIDYNSKIEDYWNYCVALGAANNGNTRLMDEYIQISSISEWPLQNLLIEAIRSQNENTFDNIMIYVKDISVDCDYVLLEISKYGTTNMLISVLNYLKNSEGIKCNDTEINWDTLLKEAINFENIKIFDDILFYGSYNDITKYVIFAINQKKYNVLKYIYEIYDNYDGNDIDTYLRNMNAKDFQQYENSIKNSQINLI